MGLLSFVGAAALGLMGVLPLPGQGRPGVSAVLLSDIHFDPFADPAKAKLLAGAPVARWDALLGGPATATIEHDTAALREVCHVRGVDTTAVLWQSSLKAMRAQGKGAAFVAVSGDLLAHNYECKFKKSFPTATDADYVAFVEQTVRYLVRGLQLAFPETPLYVAMGNNDSGCGDYRDQRNSAFLAGTAKILAQALPPEERPEMERSFAREGFYSVAMPAAVPHGRMVVLDDLFLSAHHVDCSGKPDEEATDAVVAWLRTELGQARERGDKVWVMGHIPPGVDLYSTLRGLDNVCKRAPAMFLANEKLAGVLTAYADVVRLAIFGHSHTDELRLLTREAGAGEGPGSRVQGPERRDQGVVVKIVSSISPVNGNTPSFTVARVDPATAEMTDYRVVVASNLSGVDATWKTMYTFSDVYHQPGFTPAALRKITDGFAADPTAAGAQSRAYLEEIFVGDRAILLKPFWPEYTCALTHDSAESFAGCVCKK